MSWAQSLSMDETDLPTSSGCRESDSALLCLLGGCNKSLRCSGWPIRENIISPVLMAQPFVDV